MRPLAKASTAYDTGELAGRDRRLELAADGHVTHSLPGSIDLRQYDVVRLFQVDRLAVRDPTGFAG